MRWKSELIALICWLALLFVGVEVGHSQSIPIGTALPLADQAFPTTEGSKTLTALKGTNGTAFIFWSNQCPWVEKYEERLLQLASTYQADGVNMVLVNSNDPTPFPEESLDMMKTRASERSYTIPYLKDAEGVLAKAMGAQRSPEVYLYDGAGLLFYRGTIDDSPGDPGNITQHFFKDALEALKAGSAVSVAETKAFGCMLKVKR